MPPKRRQFATALDLREVKQHLLVIAFEIHRIEVRLSRGAHEYGRQLRFLKQPKQEVSVAVDIGHA